MAKYLTKADVMKLLRQKANQVGEQKALADQFKVSPQYLSDVLNGNRDISDSILVGLGLQKVVLYQKLPVTETKDDRDSAGG